MKRTLIGIGLSVAMLTLGISRGAEASALLRLSAGGITVSCDNSQAFTATNCGAGFNTVANDSQITFNGTVDGWGPGAGGNIGVSGNQPGTPNLALALDVKFNYQHLSGTSDLTVDFAENNYSLPAGPNLLLSGTQTANWATSTNGDSQAFQVWGRSTNDLVVPGGTATAITADCVSPGGTTNSCNNSSPDVNFLRGAGNFALTGRQVIHAAIGTAAIYTGSVAVNNAVPEPASMLLLGTGLLGLARRASRRKKSL